MFTMLMVLLVVLAAGTALAGDGSWTSYGKFHSSINMLGNGQNSQLGLTSNTSRFGFKGNAPMNDDYAVTWQVELAVNTAEGGLSTTLRNSYIGVKNDDMGELRLGRHDTPHKTLGRKTTFFFDTVGDNRQTTFGTDGRISELLAWVSPNWDGFGLFLAYQFDQDSSKLYNMAPADAKFKAETLFSGMATYAKDEYLLGVSTIMYGSGYEPMVGTETGNAPMVLRFAGKYNAEKFGLAASYLTVSGQSWDASLATPAFVDMTATTIGFEGLFKASETINLKAGYYMADPNTDMDNDDYSLMTFGVDRNFGKSTQIYVQYAAMSYGDAAGNPSMGGGGNGFGQVWSGWTDPAATGTPTYENPYGFSVGLNHSW
jgi:predicted porin